MTENSLKTLVFQQSYNGKNLTCVGIEPKKISVKLQLILEEKNVKKNNVGELSFLS
jgi:hypothetical protein